MLRRRLREYYRRVHHLGGDVVGSGLGGADHMSVDAKRDGRAGMAGAARDDMNRDAGEQQGRGVDVA
jgi:hypothetical protein